MSIIKKMSDRVYYYIDIMRAAGLKVKIERFILNHSHDNITVVYRLGRQKLLNKMNLHQFEIEYFDKVSNFDQHRLVKFSTLQSILQIMFSNNVCDKQHFARFIEEHVKNEQLF